MILVSWNYQEATTALEEDYYKINGGHLHKNDEECTLEKVFALFVKEFYSRHEGATFLFYFGEAGFDLVGVH